VTARHLVADLQLALDGDEDLDHLDDARRQLVAALQALDLLGERDLDQVDLLLHRLDEARELVLDPLVADLDVAPVVRGICASSSASISTPLLRRTFRVSSVSRADVVFPTSRRCTFLPGALADDPDLVLLILPELRDLLVLDGARAVVLLDALAREDARVDDRALDARRDAEARVATSPPSRRRWRGAASPRARAASRPSA
jgi:hypothetical protein